MKSSIQTLLTLGFLITLPHLSFARVVPLGIDSSQVKLVGEKFSGLLSSHTSNSPFALGEDFEIEATAVYQDLELNEVSDIAPISSKSLLEPIISIRKGLYLDLDMSFSFLFPAESALVSGYSFNLNHSSKFGNFYFKPEIFISNYNVEDVLNINSSGLSLVVFKKIDFLYFGLGAKLESVKAQYEQQFLGGSSLAPGGSTKSTFNSASALAKLVFIPKFGRITITYVFTDSAKSEASVSVGLRL